MSIVDTPRLWLSDSLTRRDQSRLRLRVLVHEGFFVNIGPAPHYFLTVANLSGTKEVEITDVWFATTPRTYIVDSCCPLPVRLRSDETWEGWIKASALPDASSVERLGRVLLSDGTVVKSLLNRKVPAQGYVAGGRQRAER
jgi:hypothetical protein